jgi:hypothetical protein
MPGAGFVCVGEAICGGWRPLMKIEKRLIKGFDSSVTGDGDSRVIFLT